MIHYRNEVRRSGIDGRAFVRVAKRLLGAVGEAESSLSIALVGDETIRRLNRDHRGKDKPTDVLSFSLTGAPHASRAERPPRAKPVGPPKNAAHEWVPERLLGDVVISVETARRQAAQYDATLQRELYRLLIHGLLHVMGHDHERLGERKRMEAEERRLARAIALPWPY